MDGLIYRAVPRSFQYLRRHACPRLARDVWHSCASSITFEQSNSSLRIVRQSVENVRNESALPWRGIYATRATKRLRVDARELAFDARIDCDRDLRFGVLAARIEGLAFPCCAYRFPRGTPPNGEDRIEADRFISPKQASEANHPALVATFKVSVRELPIPVVAMVHHEDGLASSITRKGVKTAEWVATANSHRFGRACGDRFWNYSFARPPQHSCFFDPFQDSNRSCNRPGEFERNFVRDRLVKRIEDCQRARTARATSIRGVLCASILARRICAHVFPCESDTSKFGRRDCQPPLCVWQSWLAISALGVAAK
jgi:hypothetical protein